METICSGKAASGNVRERERETRREIFGRLINYRLAVNRQARPASYAIREESLDWQKLDCRSITRRLDISNVRKARILYAVTS
jgi:hypothetical protein